MKLTRSCIITSNVQKLTDFYQEVLQIPAKKIGDTYSEFFSEKSDLAIFDLNAHEEAVPGSSESGMNKSILLEFDVEDVDKEYERLKKLDIEWLSLPSDKYWGSRSFYFRDPDGNMISFFTVFAEGE